MKIDSKSLQNIIGNVASSYQVNLAREIHNLARFHMSTLGICNAYSNILHVVGIIFLIGQICFYLGGLGANRNMWGQLRMKLAMAATLIYGKTF